MSEQQSNHLDLGCGTNPANPYGRPHVFGVDIRDASARLHEAGKVTIVKANLALEKIPFEDNFFSSVSAVDFLEHVPRQLYIDRTGEIVYPFINLMNEIWRVLSPGGRFLAITPAYPRAAAFADPTHVNTLTNTTHTYFCGHPPGGRVYGFHGEFRAHVVRFSAPSNYRAMPPRPVRSKIRDWSRRLSKGGLQHLVWELEAIK